MYNRSENPIFVNSLTLEESESPSPTRVPAEHCLCVFDPVKASHQNYGWNFTNCVGPIDRNSVRISFAKGWGPRYSRREITSCPCWIEVLLAPCRWLILSLIFFFKLTCTKKKLYCDLTDCGPYNIFQLERLTLNIIYRERKKERGAVTFPSYYTIIRNIIVTTCCPYDIACYSQPFSLFFSYY